MDSLLVSNPRNNYSTQNNIPHDIIIDILIQLPVKSLIRFKGVCKSLYSLIKDDNFIKQHYDTHQNCQKYFVVCRRHKRKENENCTILRFCLDKEEFQQELLIPNTIPSEIHVVGEKLCLIGSLIDNHKIHEFWLYMMKTNSWNKILAIRLPSKTCLKPLSFIKDGGIMFKNYMSKYVFKAYNSTTHKLEKVNVAGLEGHNFKEVVTYIETLSSLFL